MDTNYHKKPDQFYSVQHSEGTSLQHLSSAGSVCLFTSLSVEKHLAIYYSHHADKV
jgi:hypothetical protein